MLALRELNYQVDKNKEFQLVIIKIKLNFRKKIKFLVQF